MAREVDLRQPQIVLQLAELEKVEGTTKITWGTRPDREAPFPRIDHDQLSEPDQLARQVNQRALDPSGPVTRRRSAVIESLTCESVSSEFSVFLNETSGPSRVAIPVDRNFTNVGLRPDRSFHEKLQVHACDATTGPMKLAAGLRGGSLSDLLVQ